MPRWTSHFVASLALLIAYSAAGASAIPNLFNTGVDASHNALPGGSVDPHYTLMSSADPSYPGPGAIVTSVIPAGYWAPNADTSVWIAPAADENWPALGTAHPAGQYVYRLPIDLTDFDPSTVTITGVWGVDNEGYMMLNGAQVGVLVTTYNNPLNAFLLNSGFVSGVNYLDFVITNYPGGGSNPTGLRVDRLQGTGTTTVGVGKLPAARAIELLAPWPNPAGGSARLGFTLPYAMHARLFVVDLAGHVVRALLDAERPAGGQELAWDGRNARGQKATAGVYFAVLEANGQRLSRRIVWVR
jgi:hypothetical protein